MLKDERHQLILDTVRQQNKVLTVELSQVLHVSEDTIRRDLKELSEQGQVKKVHGGAVSHSLNPYSYQDRKVYADEEKKHIAAKATKLFSSGQVVFMDGGTSNLELARQLPPHLEITLITNSLPVAVELADHPKIEIIFIGGKLLKTAQVTVGPEVIETVKSIRADLCVLGTRSIHHQLGITEIDWDETKVKRAMMESSAELISLVIKEKIDTVQPYIIGESKNVDILVSSLDRHDPIMKPYSALGIEII
ncbi:MAG: DeoR/GlpR family DNA-binding transcription regulator [Bacteroidota bacterium]